MATSMTPGWRASGEKATRQVLVIEEVAANGDGTGGATAGGSAVREVMIAAGVTTPRAVVAKPQEVYRRGASTVAAVRA